MPRYLLAVDGSENSHAALEEVAKMFVRGRDSLTILTVTEPVSDVGVVPISDVIGVPAPILFLYDDQLREEARKEAETRSQAILREFEVKCEQLKIEAAFVHLIGPAREEIMKFIEKDSPDVLVVGSRGLGFIKRLLLGSVSHFLVHHAPCPVLVVKMPAAQHAA